ncbi:peripheral-type benzodiazepine receptor-associated protein 1 [Salarias fasciatus]|uniref:peripheral-type benzodiazepine receptor-associated protein 1 n=1 Tax=Salarias fasciatus TaxID=181472 RepID=UPI001176711C|nr:peripheral-type benzodiazepine receptor-associated protein 1 [Salarias fasciatus]
MRKDRDNPLALSSKKACQDQTGYGQELERLRAELEAERKLTQRARGQLGAELRRLREKAERQQQRSVRELAARRGCQKDRESSGYLLAKDSKHHTKGDSTWGKTFSFCSRQTYTKLEKLLLTLYEKINGEKVHHRQEIELEKAIFLCHLLEAHGRLLQGTKRAGPPSSVFKSSLRKSKQEGSINSCPPTPPLSSSKPQSAFPSPQRKRSFPNAGVGGQASQSAESSGSDEPAPSKCMTANMERVMYDLCTRPEQPESARAHTEMESRGEAEALAQHQQQQQEPQDKQHRLSDKAIATNVTSTSLLGKRHHSLYANLTGFESEGIRKNGADYGFLLRQNSELLRALDILEKTCITLREENGLLRKSSAPETEEKVRRLRRKNTELAVLAKRLEDRARKLQEANLKVVNSPSLLRPGSVEQYKRAFARQRARDLAQHADVLLSKDKEIAALQQECRELEERLGTSKASSLPSGRVEFEKLLRESQKEVLRLQRQLSVSSCRGQHVQSSDQDRTVEEEEEEEKVVGETPCVALDEAPSRCEKTPGEEEEESGLRVTPQLGLRPTPSYQEARTEEQRLHFLESELSKKRKECENLEHEVKKRQKRCLDLESQLEDERGKNEQLKEEADLLRRKAQLLDQTRAENEELREDLSEVTAQHNSVLEENQRLRAKLENLEQVLKHMREVAERRQQLELEHEQALAILKFKQDEIKRLQRAQLFAKREHEGVVQMLEELTQLVLQRELSKVRELEEKCRSQSEQFGLLSQELEKFRLQASKVDLASSSLLNNPSLSVLTNGVGLTTERDCTGGTLDMVSLGEIAFWSLEGGDPLSCPEGNDPLDVAAALRLGATPHAAGLSRVERSPVTKHRELPTISVSKSGSTSSKSETAHLTPKSDTHLSPHKSSPTHEVDTASEVEELDIDVAPAPYTASRGAAKLQVFIARYSYNPYDGPNDNPEVELPLTAGEYIYVYGDMDDDGFYEGELMDGRRGLVPSNFVERVSDDDMMSAPHPETGDASHNSLLDSSLHSASHQHHLHLHTGVSASERTEASAASGPASAPSDPASALAVPAPLTNGLDLDLEEVGLDIVPYPRKLTLIKQLAKSIIIGWDPPLVPAGWGNVWSYNVYVDQELRLNVPFGSQTKAVLERLDINLKAYRVSVQSLTEKGLSDQLRCSMLVGRDVCVAPTQLRVERVTATSANLTWLPSNSNYVHIVSLNEEECELVKAGCYSLCLNNLLPSLQYTVKVEARPHRTPWELPVERREHRSTTISFSTLMAVPSPHSGNEGPPDAPLDVQLEHGPSPGIALISWLPVTIDAAGTSNGVRVTGYTIYADKKKVLEVSSPTAGSALLGPSQMQVLGEAQELTVRTTSAHGESCNSLPVNVPSKLAEIMAGPATPVPVVPPLSCSPVCPSNSPQPSYGNSAAKVSMLPSTLPSMTPSPGLTVEAAANPPPALHPDDLLSPASYVKAWADPSTAAALAMCEATSPVACAITPVVNVISPTTSAPQLSPVAVSQLSPVAVSQLSPVAVSQLSPVAAPQPPPVAAPAPEPAVAVAPVVDLRRDTDSPGTIRPFPSITEFIEDPSAKLGTPERIPTPPKAAMIDLLNPPDINLHRPPSTSPLDSEAEEEQESSRLVSIEEFLRQDQEPVYCLRQPGYGRGLVDPPTDYNADNSRSDLSDILEEEEEDLYSDHLGDAPARGYTVAASRLHKLEPPDSDEDVLERILKLPPQVYHNKQLFSIPEVTEEEDSNHEEPLSHRSKPRPRPNHLHPRDTERLHHAPQHHPHPHVAPHHHHYNRDVRSLTKEPLPRHGPMQVKPRTQHRVHYADTVDTISYPEEDMSLYEGPTSRRVTARCPPQTTSNSKDKVLLRGLGDRLRREAMLRSQMAVAAAANPGHGLTPPRSYPVSKTVRTLRSPVGRQVEIDVEYGTDDNEEPAEYIPGEVVVEQVSSEWWVEGAQVEQCRAPHRRGPKADLPDPGVVPPAEAGPLWAGQSELSCKPASSQASRQLKGNVESPKMKAESNVRIFVALFPYDPASMSPNPDAAEEELPFSEGQIIKVYGDKDADGFYRGESAGRLGYVPCNMVSEIQVEDEETRQQLLQQGFLSTVASMEKIGTRTHAQLPRRPVPPPKPRRSKKVESAALWEESESSSAQDPGQSAAPAPPAGGAAAAPAAPPVGNSASGARRMVAIFDYDPRESSPNTDIEAELTFSAGDIIHVFGDMDEDGFFYGDLNGHKGLVPSNFLQALPEDAPVCAPPPPEPKKDSQDTLASSTEPQDPGTSTLDEDLQLQTEHPSSEATENAEPRSQPAPAASPPSDPVPGPVEDRRPPPAPPRPADPPPQTDCSVQAKKKKGFFSKGKRLFKKLGSSKKE